jgi:hypothetical protein
MEPINQVALQHNQYFLVFQNQGHNNGFSQMWRLKNNLECCESKLLDLLWCVPQTLLGTQIMQNWNVSLIDYLISLDFE